MEHHAGGADPRFATPAQVTHASAVGGAPAPDHQPAPEPHATEAGTGRTLAHRLGSAAAGLGVVVALGLAALMLVPAALGYHRYVITGDSMSGSYDRGSVVFDEQVPVSELEVGDAITYDPPADAGIEGPITHRIVSMRDGPGGETKFRTKGDANESADPWTFSLDQPMQARVEFHVPYVGYVFAVLGIRFVRLLLIGLPALLIAVALLARLWREAGEELRRREAAPGLGAGPAASIAWLPAGTLAVAAPAAGPVAPLAPTFTPPVSTDQAQAPPVRTVPPTADAGLPDLLARRVAQARRRAQASTAPTPAAPAGSAPDPELREDVQRLRLATDGLFEQLVRLRGRVEGARLA